eukprot:403342144
MSTQQFTNQAASNLTNKVIGQTTSLQSNMASGSNLTKEQMLQQHNLYHHRQAGTTYVSNEPRIMETHTHMTNVTSVGAPIIERSYDQTATIIRHDEKTLYETHTAPTVVESQTLPVKIESHMNQPIIKEHHKDIIHEHHQNIVHEHHKNIIHEAHQNVIHEHHQPIIHTEDIREIHQPVIHETHKEIIHDINKPFIHERHQDVIEEQFKGPVIHEEYTKPVVHQEYNKPIIEKTVQPTIIQKEEVLGAQHQYVQQQNVQHVQHVIQQPLQSAGIVQFTNQHHSHKCKVHTHPGCRECQECVECDKIKHGLRHKK